MISLNGQGADVRAAWRLLSLLAGYLLWGCLLSIPLLSFPDMLQAQTGPVASSPAASQAAEAEPTMSGQETAPDSLLSIIFSGGIVGISIMLVLIGLSLTAAYLVFDHLLSLRRADLLPEGLADAVRQHLLAGRVDAASQACQEKPSLLAFVLSSGLAEVEGGWAAVEKAIEDALAEQSARLLRKVEYLSVIGNLAPMVGLLGTVTGMIMAFRQVATTQGSAGAGELAEGIYQALVTTVGGLLIAIPSLGAFAVFRNRVDQFVAEAASAALHVFTPLKRHAQARQRAKAAPAPPPVDGGR